MKTIKCRISNGADVSEYIRKYNSVLHIAYNRIKKGISQSDIKKETNVKFKGLNSFIIQNAIVQAKGMFDGYQRRKKDFESRFPGKKMKEIVFGGRKNLKRYLNKLISKEEFKDNRTMPMTIAGETRQKGNRLFEFDIENNIVTFKPKKGTRIKIEFVASNKQKRELVEIQGQCAQRRFSVAVSLGNRDVSFCFDEVKLNKDRFFFKNLKRNRVLGIDQNPQYVGLSILDFHDDGGFEVVHKRIFDMSNLVVGPNNPPCGGKNAYAANKRRFETLGIAHYIDDLVKTWHVGKVVVEDLQFKSNLKSCNLNRICKNSWNRILFENKLEMLAKMHGYELTKINPCYTSVVGNILYGNDRTPDMVAASIEIARRGYTKFQKGQFYPDFDWSLSRMNEQWKQTSFDNSIGNWKELFSLIKNSKLKYRVFLDRIPSRNLRKFSLKC